MSFQEGIEVGHWSASYCKVILRYSISMNFPLLCVLWISIASLGAQTKLPPDVANASYGPHERNVLDLWKAKSDRPTSLVIYIHGGGFKQGDKSGVSPFLLDACLKQGISVASINYRYS